jgi:DNA polymerase III alpha subunit/intein/homing endonuclease
MAKSPFVSLHNHTELGSPLDGMNDTYKLFEQAKLLNHRAIAITDHGTLTAHYDAWKASQKTGVKLIPGIEIYFAPDLEVKKSYHLVLLPKNHNGYKNILRLNYEAYKNQVSGYMGKKTPRVTWEHLESFNQDIICLTACSNGPIAKALIADADEDEALARLDRLISIFGENFYLELQPHNLKTDDGRVDQVRLNNTLVKYAREKGLKYVATSDAHYLDSDHAKYHDMMLAIKDKKAVDDPDRFRYGVQDMYLKSHDEIIEFFGREIAEVAMSNSVHIAEMCEEPTYLEPKGPRLPRFPIEEEKDYDQFKSWYSKQDQKVSEDKAYLRFQCMKSFKKNFSDLEKEKKKEYWERVKYELSILEARDFSSYMLIVADYINWSKQNGIPVGPGRGCICKDIPVYTKRGTVNIQDVKIGDIVFSHTGKERLVTNTMVYPVKEELLNISTYYGDFNSISMTKDHKVFGQKTKYTDKYLNSCEKTRKKVKKYEDLTSDIIEIEAQDLSVGDWIFYPDMEWKEETPTWHFENNEIAVQTNVSSPYSSRSLKKATGVSRSKINMIMKNGYSSSPSDHIFEEYVKNNFGTLENLISLRDSKSKTFYKINKDISLGKDLAWLFGKWTADGWLAEKGSWGVAFHEDETDQLELTKSVLLSIGVSEFKVFPHKTKKLNQLTSSNPLLVSMFKEEFPDYSRSSHTKHVPGFVFSLPKNLLKSFLKGCIDGDGHVEGTRVRYTTVSRRLSEEIKMISNMLGFPASIKKEVRIYKHLGHSHESENYKVSFPINEKKSYNYKRIDGGFLVRVRDISTVNDINFVYDITVDEDHSYMTTHGAIHNSAGGSIVSYLTGITSVNPMDYGLLFERFHNKEKKSFPDIDTDFANPARVKEYLKNKYGEDKVASISNWSTLSPKVIIKDVARSLRLGGDKSAAFKIANHITSIMPDTKTIEEAMKMSAEFKKQMDRYPKLLEFASKLQGLTRNWSVHAAGVVISDEPLYNFVPLRIDDSGQLVTQWEKNRCEENGLIKMDILGLKTLTVIEGVFDNIRKTKNINLSIDDIPIDDEKTYDMISRGDNAGVFQLESSLSPLCQKIKPFNVRMISDINAMGRPSCSPIDRNNYIKRRFGKESVKYRHMTLENSLKDTYGISLYEEGMMSIAKDCAGWDLNQADALRKITKLKGKDPELVMKTEMSFLEDCMNRTGMSYESAMDIWQNEILPFGNYGFNLSHSILYSHISVYTAWLKCHYPTEFMCALLNSEDPNSDKAQEYINECKRMKIEILPPHVNLSEDKYSITGERKITCGFSAIKGLGVKAVDEIVENKPFKCLQEFLGKCNGRTVGKTAIQALAKCGAFSCFEITRKDIHDNYSKFRAKINKEVKKGKDLCEIELKFSEEEWDQKETLMNERAVLGRTISGQLHDAFKDFFSDSSMVTRLNQVQHLDKNKSIRVEGVIKSLMKEFKIKNGKNIGKKFGKYLVEDKWGNTSEMTLWTNDYEKYKSMLIDGIPFKAICSVNEYMGKKDLSLKNFERIYGRKLC